MNMDGWHPLITAPRDGSLIELTADDFGEVHLMRWNPKGGNPLVQSAATGIWEAPDRSYTWSEENPEGAPTHWRHHYQ